MVARPPPRVAWNLDVRAQLSSSPQSLGTFLSSFMLTVSSLLGLRSWLCLWVWSNAGNKAIAAIGAARDVLEGGVGVW